MKHTVQRTVSPIDGSVYVERKLAASRDIERALGRAVGAQAKWKQVPVPERAAIVRKMVEWCVARADRIGEELTRQMGRPIAYTPNEIRRGFQERSLHMCSLAEEALADISITPGSRFIRREPLGVVLVVAPWNYPWLTSVNAIVPALLAGNSVVLKMAQQTPLVAERYAEAFAAAGLPAGVFQYLHMDHAQTARVIGDARVAFVAFTGSVEGGHAVQLVRAHIKDALGKGAKALIDAKSFPADKEGTPYVAPQVLVDVDHRMQVMTEETFGPVVGIMAVDGDEQAIQLMNDSRYGLTASIWTADADAAVRIGDLVETGTWFMNRCDYLDPALAWTGVKDSGRGCTLSKLGLEAFTRPKSFHLKLR